MYKEEFDDCTDDKDTKFSSKFHEVDKVCIGCPKPCITTILEGAVKVEIKDKKVIKHCDGFKLIVSGCKFIKIKYCSNDKCGCNKIFTETFVVPFKQALDFCGCYMELCDLDAYVEKCSIKKVSSRCAVVKSTIVVDPYFEEPKYDYWDDDWDCECEIDSCCKKKC
ncbi:SPOCS domain-containing protein [Clostridium thermarum]|uniref:SPOCS domain-containing protein n=1 Tax=Clostridium thermarum TaxID=1716543 RepID=UPI0013D2245F|nr:SPOCS domain-containing protein [Clostridium thermarum]